jgi:hypothetical protein
VQSDIWVSYPPTPAPNENPAVAALVDFAQRGAAATTADVDHVMRCLASHSGWWVPVEYARQTWGQSDFDQTMPFEDKGPLAMLNVFTHAEAAAAGEASASGDYGGPVPGVLLLQNLDPGLSSLFVNPGSPREHQWYIETGGFDIAAAWASAVAVERALATWGSGPVPAGDLLGHHYQLLIDKQTQAPAQVLLPEIDGVVMVCFTAGDRTAEFVAGLPATARAFAETSPVEGRAMFELVRTTGAAGVVINAGSDDQTALTGADIAQIVGARR